MTCKTMKQNENDQNHKKESTPVVDDKPNGKSQFMINNLTFDSPDEIATSIVKGESVVGIWQCERVASKSFGVRARYVPSTPSWLKSFGGIVLASFLPIAVLFKIKGHPATGHNFFDYLMLCWLGALVIWAIGNCYYSIKDALNYSRVADLLIITPQRLFVVLDIYLNKKTKSYCVGSVQPVEKSLIKLKRRYFSIWTLYLSEPECGFNNAKTKKLMRFEHFPVIDKKKVRALIDKFSQL